MASPSNNQHPEPNNIRPLTPPTAIRHRGRNAEKPYPTNAQLSRLLERRRALELGYELPLDTEEATLFVGYKNPKTVERMARNGEIPAHPISGARRKTWRFYPSELDAWLRAKVNSHRYPCSLNGKDSVN